MTGLYRLAGLVGGAVVLIGLLWWAYAREIRAAEKRGEERAYAAVAAKAIELKGKADALGRDVSALVRSINNETNLLIARRADAVRVRGPGAAICPGAAGPAAAAGGRDAPGGGADAGVDRLPYPAWEPLIAMPFAELVDRAERCDLNRAEAIAWRDWHKQLTAAWAAPKEGDK